MRTATLLLAVAACGLAALPAHAQQRVPFFNAAGTGFDPEISVVNSGQLLDAQVAVSNDLKYVTINTRASSSRLLALREFTFAEANGNAGRLGFVGGAGGAAEVAADGRGVVGQRLPRAGGGGGDRPNSLDRGGMTLVSRLRD